MVRDAEGARFERDLPLMTHKPTMQPTATETAMSNGPAVALKTVVMVDTTKIDVHSPDPKTKVDRSSG